MVKQVSSLKTGLKYKETSIGKIPVDWEVKRLIDTSSNKKYSFTGGPFGSDLKENCYTDNGVRIIQLQNISDGEFLDDYKIFTSEEKADQLKSCNIYPGDIIIAKMADPVARACILPNIDKRYLMASDGIRLSINKKDYDSNFVLYAINSTYFRENAERHSTGTTRLRIGLTELRNLPIGIPQMKEQKEIAEILTTVDDAIEKTNQIIDKTKELKKGLMQRLLTRGIGHKKFKKSEIGEIPVEWDVGDISGYGDIITGNTPSTSVPQYYSKEYPFASPFDLGEKKTIIETAKYLSKYGLSAARALPPNAVLVVCIGSTIGKTGVAGVTLATNQQINSVICKNSDFNFVYYYMSFIGKKIKLLSSTQAVPIINKGEFSKIRTAIPPIDEQKKIGDILSSIDNQMEKESNHKEQLNLLKKGLMQVLLTGRLRVRV